MCQICNKLGHTAIDCYHRMDYAYQGKHPPTKLGAMATTSNASLAQEQPWLANNVVTDHVIANLNQLNFPQPYGCQDHLTVGNEQNLPITHIGNSLIPSSYSNLQLHNVPRVPSISSNLASVHKICQVNNCWCYFDQNCPFRLWPRGRSYTKARVKMEFTPSILTELPNFTCLPKSVIKPPNAVTMCLSLLFLISHCGT